MSTILPIDKKRSLALGLEWVLSQGAGIRQIAAENEALACIQLNHNDTATVGLSKQKLPRQATYSLAALMVNWAAAQNIPNAIFCIKVAENLYSVVGLLEGLPSPGYDRVGPLDEVRSLADKFVAHWRPIASLTCFSDEPWDDEYQPISVDVFLELLDEKSHAAAARMGAIPVDLKKTALLAIVVLSTVGYFGWDRYTQWQAEEAITVAEASQKSPQQLYDESLPGAFAKVGWPLSEALRLADNLSQTLELERGGWRVQSLSCAQATASCQLKWLRSSKTATFQTFLQDLPEERGQRMVLSSDTITESHPVTAPAMPPIPREQLKPPAYFFGGIISGLQRLAQTGSAQYSMTDAIPLGSPAGKIIPLRKGGITFSGEAWLMPMLHKLPSKDIAVTSFDVTTGEKPSFRIELNYFSK